MLLLEHDHANLGLPIVALEFARICMGWDGAEVKHNQPDRFLFRARGNESPDAKP